MTASTASFVDSRDFARIACAIRYIDEHYREQPRLATVAARANLSEFHFNRLFRRWAGVTPKQYLAFVTGTAAKDALKSQPSVLDAAYSVGLSGPGRLHDLIVTLDAMTPGELKAQGRGILIRYGFSNTPFGTALLASTPRGVCHLAFVDPGKERAAARELQERWPDARLSHDDKHANAIAQSIWAEGSAAQPRAHPKAKPLPVNVAGTNFQLKVWQALLDLGGQGGTTYTAVAGAIGQPSGPRAVGQAVGANPVGWLIPCHNVLRKDGELGGYQWGSERKRAMRTWQSLPAISQNM
ncbi:MAG TPA: methylated-DNA--[protein]-cysteine S-methyltransferase [Steroidobacteraceae bacterium]|jgi:AraC family transcriptional regulator of adaptative response/methylated-DNA-[protein]-cysteine methyltransferase